MRLRPWQRKPTDRRVVFRVPMLDDDPSVTQWVDLAGQHIVEQTIFRLELHDGGKLVYWTEGGARSCFEDAARVAADRVSRWHDFPVTFDLTLRRLRNATPEYPVPHPSPPLEPPT